MRGNIFMNTRFLLILFCCGAAVLLEAGERRIFVARHCQAAGKGKDVIRPVKGDAGITKLGIMQSKLLGKRLKQLKFNGPVYASPYYRTVATACYAAAECGSKVFPDARVQERPRTSAGNMPQGGATLEQLRKLFPDQISSEAKLAYPWVSKIAEPDKKAHQKRMAKALDEILAENPGKDIMIVSHAGAVSGLAREMQARSGMKVSGGTWNCALFIYKVDEKGRFSFAGYDILFLPDDALTANLHKVDPKHKKASRKYQSGIDPEYDL